jgi:lipopolysaccharide/colanic/teichoic acid biosynthesis glycosyltransferase
VAAVLKVIEVGERAAALLAFILLLPILILAAAAICFLSGRAPLVAHRRVGRFGRPFWMLKFRTMWHVRRPFQAAAAFQGGVFVEHLQDAKVPETKRSDARVSSAFARWCRRYSIDELPQLWHVIRGEMSLVGPRPITAAEWDRFYGPSASEVLRLKPGITGLWQTRGRNRLTYPQRRRLDLFLSRHYCLWLYMRILGATIPRVFAGRDAW